MTDDKIIDLQKVREHKKAARRAADPNTAIIQDITYRVDAALQDFFNKMAPPEILDEAMRLAATIKPSSKKGITLQFQTDGLVHRRKSKGNTMSTSTKEKEITASDAKVSKVVQELAGRFKQEMRITDTGLATTPEDLYEKTLPEGLTMDLAKQLKQHDRHVMAAHRMATGELAVPFLVANPKIDQVTSEIVAINDVFGSSFARKHEVPDGKNGTKIVYGHAVSYYESAVDHTASDLTPVNKYLAALAGRHLANDD